MEDYKAQYYSEALLHFGVKGMRWGVRRKRLGNRIMGSRLKRIDTKINRLKKKRENQSQKLVNQLSKNGSATVRQFNKPTITNSKIKYAKIKRSGIKAGDSRNTTRLKLKKQKLNDRIIKSQNGFALTGEISYSDLKKMQKDTERISKIDKKLANKKRKKRQ